MKTSSKPIKSTEMHSPQQDPLPPDWARWSAERPRLLGPLPGGLTNCSYLLGSGERKLVLRLNSPVSSALNLDRRTERQALQHADAEGLAAPLVYCDPNYGYLVTEFIQAKPWSLPDHCAVTDAATLLRNIHHLPPVDSRLDIAAKATHYWQSIDRSSDYYYQLEKLAPDLNPRVAEITSRQHDLCLCHNDLLQDNLIMGMDGRLRAIDWEYAAMGDPFYDLAVIVEGHQLDFSLQQTLLSAYLGRPPNTEDWQRLLDWQVIYAYLSTLWFGVRCSVASPPVSVLTYGFDTQLKRLAGLMGSAQNN